MNKNFTSRILLKSIIFGIIAIILTDVIFLFVFPSAWIFFIIPAFMAFCLTKFVKIPDEILQDVETFNKLSTRIGILIALICFCAILISIIPLAIYETDIVTHLLYNFIFYIVCGIAIYTGYNRGVEIVTNAAYQSYYKTIRNHQHNSNNHN